MLQIHSMSSPIGPLTVAAAGRRVCLLHFGPDSDGLRRTLGRWYPGAPIETHEDPAGAIGALRHYFAGDVDALDRVDVELNGTPFQRSVWSTLRTIAPGRTATYSDVAKAIGAPGSVRAVGAANGANPVALIVPCHRIIGSDGSLTGYGGGLDHKRWLLQHEGALLL